MLYTSFRKTVWDFYKKDGRHDLPWRKTRDPYKILVSEVMLQQTQVERVIPFYKNFIKQFPTARKLAAAPLAEVLKSWQGLGYNRRAKLLWQAAPELSRLNLDTSSTRSNLVTRLEELPGVGPYTARAVAAFAYNQDVIFVETNIRTAIIHHFFTKRTAGKSSTRCRIGTPAGTARRRPGSRALRGEDLPAVRVTDKQIILILEKLLPNGKSREWYSALMDYGAHLKQSGIKLNAKSKHYAKQSKFAGSLREARGAILKELARGSSTSPRLAGLLGDDRVLQLQTALAALLAEQLIQKRGNRFQLPR